MKIIRRRHTPREARRDLPIDDRPHRRGWDARRLRSEVEREFRGYGQVVREEVGR